MRNDFALNEDLVQRLPLPLAQIYRRAHNAKAALERHLTAFSLWEACLKLLASVAIVEYAHSGASDPQVAKKLQNLARPQLGHWWEFVRLLLPVASDRGDESLRHVRDVLLGRTFEDFPRAAGLDAALRQALGGKKDACATVRFTELFDRLVQYRNKIVGHGSPGQLKDDFSDGMARALLAAATEVLGRLDILAARRLVYIAEIRQAFGLWLVQRYELVGESARRIATLELPRSEAVRLPDAEHVYLEHPLLPSGECHPPDTLPKDAGAPRSPLCSMRDLHPLLVYDADAEEVLFLNARRGQKQTEYLCYTTGRTANRSDLGDDQRALLTRLLGVAVDSGQVDQWATRSHAEEPPVQPQAGPRPRTLGDFELVSVLGRGGMGVVYRAWQPSLGRQVAIKKLLQTGETKTEIRFRREIRALGRVDHPNLVRIFLSGADGDQWFYAMELVQGANLSAICDRLQTIPTATGHVDLQIWRETLATVGEETRRAEKAVHDAPVHSGDRSPGPAGKLATPPFRSLTAARSYVRHVCGLMVQVAKAAHALHEGGIIHRDVKPGNIMVTIDGNQAVLMDLGLAQLADEIEGRVTRTRQFVGTLRYASPEQVLAAGRVDRRTDIYGLGATLWELLTLRPMFGATEQTPTAELMQRIQYEEPARLRKHQPGIARDLDAIVLKCLQKDPKKRYATARELAQDLQRFLTGEPARARPVGDAERLWRWYLRNRLVGGLLATIVFLLVGIFLASMFALRAEERAGAAKAAQKARITEARMLLLRLGRKSFRRPADPRTSKLIEEIEDLEHLEELAERVLDHKVNTWEQLLQ